MKTIHTFTIRAFYLVLLMLFWISPCSGEDKLTDLSQIPLVNDAGSIVRPNMMFILDNSGSMDFSFMPDYVGYSNGDASNPSNKCRRYRTSFGTSTTCAGARDDGNALTEGGDPPVFSPQFNTIYYNPEIRYAPPVSPCDPSQTLPGMTAGNTSNWTAVAVQGHQINDTCGQTSGTTNLVTGYPERIYCNSSSTNTMSDCRRNGIDVSTLYVGDYDYPDTTKTNSTAPINWYDAYDNSGSTRNPREGTYPYGRNYTSSNPHYFLISPIEHCSDATLTNCVLSATATAANPVPAYVRACKSSEFASDTAAVSGNSSGSAKCQARFTSTYEFARYGSFKRVDIVSGTNSYAKGNARTDCAGATCTYAEEMTNFANWYAYYRTRMQTMKSAAGHAFSTIDDAYRVGFITINPANSSNDSSPVVDSKYLPIEDFTSTQKTSWYKKLYAQNPNGGTPLREALSRVGRHYAKKTDGINSGMTGDPVQYECQANFALLTTDGYWNGNQGVKIDGSSAIGNQDNSNSGYSTRSIGAYDGNLNGASNTLADVAMYYYKTDLRTDLADNLKPTDKDIAKHQHMTTFTLGLGLNGELTYQPDYETAITGDFSSIKAGTKNWPVPAANTASALDDLWHAAVNGRGVYFSAKDPASLVSGIQGALGAVTVRTGAAAASATSSPNITPSDNFIYSSTYRTFFWDGEVVAKTIDTQTGAVSAGNVWSAQASLDGKVGATEDNRVIYKADLDATSPLRETFIWTNLNDAEKDFFRNKCASLSQCSILDTDARTVANDGQAMLGFLRGQTGNENVGSVATVNKAFRDREHTLGDTVNATPAFVKVPRFNFTDNVSPAYSQFKSDNATRQGALYIAANDGMLHALNSDNGSEMWAYVPKAVMPNMHKLADKNYSSKHKYFVDGSPQAMDIYAAGWKTILVGGFNAGGRGYYALDVTVPGDPKVLWEFCHDPALCNVSDTDLGYTYGNPVIAKLPSGQWVVMVTSGYNNVAPGDGKGYLYVLNATTGAILQKVTTGVGDTGLPADDTSKIGPSGLAKISAWADLGDLDATATYVYGGDLLGNLWRFDLSTTPATVTRVATLKGPSNIAQPITTKPELGKVPGVTDRVVFVGTGKYLGEPDLTDSTKQSIYAIRDTGTTYTSPRTVLTPRTISQGGGNATIAGGSVDWANGGWYADFPESKERVNIDPQLVLGTLVVATATPSGGSCSVGGQSWIYQFDFATGLSVPGANSVGQQNSAGLIVGIVIFRLPNGQLKGVSTVGDGSQNTFGVNLNSAGTGSKRTGWREITK